VQVRLADIVERAVDAALEQSKWLSTVLVWWKPPVRTYSSALWLTEP
jgi:hypothetical protein